MAPNEAMQRTGCAATYGVASGACGHASRQRRFPRCSSHMVLECRLRFAEGAAQVLHSAPGGGADRPACTRCRTQRCCWHRNLVKQLLPVKIQPVACWRTAASLPPTKARPLPKPAGRDSSSRRWRVCGCDMWVTQLHSWGLLAQPQPRSIASSCCLVALLCSVLPAAPVSSPQRCWPG